MPKANTISTAMNYIARGYNPIPVRFMSKQPIPRDWTNLKIDDTNVNDFFSNDNVNIGVVLGQASNGLIDIDFDDPDAIKFAPRFLPETKCVFGRASNPKVTGSTKFRTQNHERHSQPAGRKE